MWGMKKRFTKPRMMTKVTVRNLLDQIPPCVSMMTTEKESALYVSSVADILKETENKEQALFHLI
jgi:hypothetical protein